MLNSCVATGVVRDKDGFVVHGFIRSNFNFLTTAKAFQDKSSVTFPPVTVCGPDGILAINDPISVQVGPNKGEQVGIALVCRPRGGRGAELGDVPIAMAIGLLQRVIGRIWNPESHATLPAFKLEESTSLTGVEMLGQLSEDDKADGTASIRRGFQLCACVSGEIEGAALSAGQERRLAHLEPPNRGSTTGAQQSKAESTEGAPLNPANLKVAYTPLRISDTRSTSPDRIFPNKHLGEVNHNGRYFQ